MRWPASVTGADGTFTLQDKLPAGTYTLTVWHEKYGKVDKEITVKDGDNEFALSVPVK